MVTTATVDVETLVTVEVGVAILRQSQALEIAEGATAVSQVGIGGLALRSMTSGSESALKSTGPRRARAFWVVAGGFPGTKITEVEAVPLVKVVVVVDVLVVFATETAVVVVGCMPRKDEQKGVAL